MSVDKEREKEGGNNTEPHLYSLLEKNPSLYNKYTNEFLSDMNDLLGEFYENQYYDAGLV
jgi:hypothetical protein